jgi:hypothetical protein
MIMIIENERTLAMRGAGRNLMKTSRVTLRRENVDTEENLMI